MNTQINMETSSNPAFDMEARHIVEALRSGIPSRVVGQYFTEARPKIMSEINSKMESVSEYHRCDGMIVTGKYGEGKTHLLNTIFRQAERKRMVVSLLPLGKETPMDKLHLLYPKIIENTYLPGRSQPGFSQLLEQMTANSPVATEMIAFAAKHLETDKLYFLLRAYLGTEDVDERFQLQADLEGDFIASNILKQIYRRIYNQPVKFNTTFRKTKHTWDYFVFMNHFFLQHGYSGWVILFDEGELIGRLGKKTRLKAYFNMGRFLYPGNNLLGLLSIFAFSASYVEDVIDGKGEFESLAENYATQDEPAKQVLNHIIKSPQLVPLSRDEFRIVLEKILYFHEKAYHWKSNLSVDELEKITKDGGFLLRTKIRAAIECLDQQYQYGQSGSMNISDLDDITFEEEEVSLKGFLP